MFVNNQNRHQWHCYEVIEPYVDHKWIWRQGSLTPKQINFFHSERMDQQTAYWSADGRMDGRTTKQTTGQKEKDKGRWTNRWTDRWLTEKTVRQPVKITANTNYPRANFFRCAKPPKHLHHTNLGENSTTVKKKVTAWFSLGDFSLKILMELSDVIPLPFNCSSL